MIVNRLALLALGCLTLTVTNYAQGAEPECLPKRTVAVPLPTDVGYFLDGPDLTDTTPAIGLHGNQVALSPERRKFCARTDHDILNPMRMNPATEGAIAFRNPSGPLHTGSCWSHTRFQRSIAYLGNFQPELPKPTEQQAAKIISDLISMNKVVPIPGFANVNEFTRAYQEQLSSALGNWYARCLFTGDCAHRAGDASSEDQSSLRNRMDHLSNRMFSHPQMIFLRMKGKAMGWTDSHSWLLLNITPLRAKPEADNPLAGLTKTGYVLTIVDPNYPSLLQTVSYSYGDTSLRLDGDVLLPHEDYDDDLTDFDDALTKYCVPPRPKKK